MKKKAQKMTIEKLARMSQREFLSVGERFDGVDKRFDRVDQQLEKNSEDIGILRRDTEAGFGAMSHGMKTIIEKLNDIQGDVVELHDLRSRIERLEKKVGLPR